MEPGTEKFDKQGYEYSTGSISSLCRRLSPASKKGNSECARVGPLHFCTWGMASQRVGFRTINPIPLFRNMRSYSPLRKTFNIESKRNLIRVREMKYSVDPFLEIHGNTSLTEEL